MSKHKPNLVQLIIFSVCVCVWKWPTYLKGFVISLVRVGFINCHCCLFSNGLLFQFVTVDTLLVDVADHGI